MPKNKKKERDLKFNKIPLEPAQEEELSEFTEIDESDLILENWQKMGNKMFLLNLGVKSADIKNYFEYLYEGDDKSVVDELPNDNASFFYRNLLRDNDDTVKQQHDFDQYIVKAGDYKSEFIAGCINYLYQPFSDEVKTKPSNISRRLVT